MLLPCFSTCSGYSVDGAMCCVLCEVLSTLHAGDSFGELSLLYNIRREAREIGEKMKWIVWKTNKKRLKKSSHICHQAISNGSSCQKARQRSEPSRIRLCLSGAELAQVPKWLWCNERRLLASYLLDPPKKESTCKFFGATWWHFKTSFLAGYQQIHLQKHRRRLCPPTFEHCRVLALQHRSCCVCCDTGRDNGRRKFKDYCDLLDEVLWCVTYCDALQNRISCSCCTFCVFDMLWWFSWCRWMSWLHCWGREKIERIERCLFDVNILKIRLILNLQPFHLFFSKFTVSKCCLY